MQGCAKVVGLGKIGLFYDLDVLDTPKVNQCMTHCKAISDSNLLHLCSVSDIDSDREKLATSIYNVESCNQAIYQLGVIATPTFSHLQNLIELIATARPRKLLLEKPAGLNSRECRAIDSLCSENNIEVFVNYFRRYLTGTLEARKFFKSLKQSNLRALRVQAYGNLHNIFSHFVDLTLWLVGDGILCMCPKRLKGSKGGEFKHECNSCSTILSIQGLGGDTALCEVEMLFEDFHLLISDSGKKIVFTLASGQIQTFETDNLEYLNYQSVVISTIEENGDLSKEVSGLSQAIQVHDFLETLEFEYEQTK